MAVFLSHYVNRIDKKGRVSVPASFRAVLGGDAQGIVAFRSLHHEALDACSVEHLELLSNSLEQLDLAPDIYELIETTIFGGSVHLPFDGEGRISLPETLASAVGIEAQVVFVGRRKTFQLWEPARFTAHESAARSAARAKDISLSKIIAQATAKLGEKP
ncbi:MAG: MraZ family transcriptional regulator [Alphaproteobacteria bacterium]|nr:MraZ family transcriptional regulator [Alphaproteobacteria bacterium]